MTTSRQKVLNHLKKTRSASAREIARALKMSAPNVRHHLSVLCADGRVEMTQARPPDGRGRPENLYSLAQSALGDNLSVLADALLSEGIDAKKTGERIAKMQGLSELSKQPIAKRLHLLVEKLNEMRYQARWEAGAEGPRVILGRCPYSQVIENHPELCTMDEALLAEALARPILQTRKGEAVSRGMCPFVFQVG
jgi:predicted ArsR family transcriptional regulator